MESKSQKMANKRWKMRNKTKQDYYRSKSTAKQFILKRATSADLRLFIQIINNRLKRK